MTVTESRALTRLPLRSLLPSVFVRPVSALGWKQSQITGVHDLRPKIDKNGAFYNLLPLQRRFW
jgi:hypothetical protein